LLVQYILQHIYINKTNGTFSFSC